MAVLLFKLRGVPDDEANDIRQLLDDSAIDYYETSAGNWGTAVPAIWLRDELHLKRARHLIEAYQQQRSIKQREIYDQLKREGKQRTFWTLFQEAPLKIIAYIAIVLVILYFSTKPFLSLGN
ncbi:MAG TPA: hypothetical protein ENI97_11870 [Gammaproteobacteria bacterium]|nr:hypothetical protein [Gammaproteobacteria bacterium]